METTPRRIDSLFEARVFRHSGDSLELSDVVITPDSIHGTRGDSSARVQVSIPRAEVARIESFRLDGLKTIGLLGLASAFVLAMALVECNS